MDNPNYEPFKRDALRAFSHIGKVFTVPGARRLMSAQQVKRSKAPNPLSSDVWQYRSLAGGAVLVEISYGHGFRNSHMLGLTVFHVGALAALAEDGDREASGAFSTIGEAAVRLHELNLIKEA